MGQHCHCPVKVQNWTGSEVGSRRLPSLVCPIVVALLSCAPSDSPVVRTCYVHGRERVARLDTPSPSTPHLSVATGRWTSNPPVCNDHTCLFVVPRSGPPDGRSVSLSHSSHLSPRGGPTWDFPSTLPPVLTRGGTVPCKVLHHTPHRGFLGSLSTSLSSSRVVLPSLTDSVFSQWEKEEGTGIGGLPLRCPLSSAPHWPLPLSSLCRGRDSDRVSFPRPESTLLLPKVTHFLTVRPTLTEPENYGCRDWQGYRFSLHCRCPRRTLRWFSSLSVPFTSDKDRRERFKVISPIHWNKYLNHKIL